jgi:acetyl-CoA carboxylase carboxyl transferase subunit alpha
LATGKAIMEALAEFEGRSPQEIRAARADKFLAIGRKI